MGILKACVEGVTDVWWQMAATFMQKTADLRTSQLTVVPDCKIPCY